VGAREEAGAGSRMGATEAGVPRAADSSKIGMGAMKSGLVMEYASAVGKEKFWVTHLFAVRYPNRPMRLAYGFGLSETISRTIFERDKRSMRALHVVGAKSNILYIGVLTMRHDQCCV